MAVTQPFPTGQALDLRYFPTLNGASYDPVDNSGSMTSAAIWDGDPDDVGSTLIETVNTAAKIATGEYSFTLAAIGTSGTYYARITWEASGSGPTVVDDETFVVHDFGGDVGPAGLFTVAEFRAAHTEFTDATRWPDATITAVSQRLADEIEEAVGVSFRSRSKTETHDGDGGYFLLLDELRPQSVTSATANGASIDETALKIYKDGRLYRAAGWPTGFLNISVTYVHGYAATPEPIKRAAMLVAKHQLAPSDLVSSRAMSVTDEMGTMRLSTPDGVRRFYGIPEVDATLAAYFSRAPGVS